ncbi:Alpha/beta hydrolase family protein [Rubripirellula amarantea]|uniref:Alpha/beta hydrolase family protein n=1 Tax=Rubripirellula amarantea TaxID=2527999 RepID=A0A5C5WC11_9BACT|nr:prolyl oligopeptidase family serine peptidase [Rubripirellula amarantea]TWT48184.1 Alpha/beta hydrolase family protein [Rubripirellula amarantea]
MARYFLLFFLVFGPAHSIKSLLSASEFEHATFQRTEGETMQYLLALPEAYASNTSERFPLLLFLHGGGESGSDIEKVKTHGPPKQIAAGMSLPFVLLAPQNPHESQFWDDQTLADLLDSIESDYRIDPDRIYLSGMSRGGFGAWRLAIQKPNRFAALVPICGGGDAPYAKKINHLPTWVFHGAKDPVIPISESQQMVDALEAAGGNVMFTIYPEADHDSWTETYDNPRVYQWMLEQTRKVAAP